MSHIAMSERHPSADQVAALGAAYERYVARLRALNRLRLQREGNGSPEHAAQLAHARCLTEEAYAQWRALVAHMCAASRAEKGGHS